MGRYLFSIVYIQFDKFELSYISFSKRPELVGKADSNINELQKIKTISPSKLAFKTSSESFNKINKILNLLLKTEFCTRSVLKVGSYMSYLN